MNVRFFHVLSNFSLDIMHDEMSILKIKAFLNYANLCNNYMHVFLLLIITDKMRPFGAFKLF